MPTPILPAQPDHVALSVALKEHTRTVHARLDQHLLHQHIFASRQRYLGFLRVQWHFHHTIAPLYRMWDPGTTRLALIEEDLRDLGAIVPVPRAWRPQPHAFSKAAAVGWRYVAEGSTLGAAVLLKMAAALQLHAGYGARHLRPSELGVAECWRRERDGLDALVLSADERAQACVAATDAFQFVRRCVDEEFRFE
ncbi:biliverdin-producing heme oxygenase [Stenotrophomonas maltophilia]|nr:biliverdin-producing heme oxygenase [Stenotrophomonas maltophilia]